MITTFPVAAEIPKDLLAKVGQIIAQWSYVEFVLRTMLYELLEVDPKRGRVAVRAPRAEEYLTMYRQILQIAGKKMPTEFEGLKTKLRNGKRDRDLLAHGVWGKVPDTDEFAVQWTSGTWDSTSDSPQVSRKITPAGMVMTMRALEGISASIKEASDQAVRCLYALFPDGTSREKSR